MGRRKKKSGPDAVDLAKGILGLGLLLVLWLSGGNLKKFVEASSSQLAIVILIGIVVVSIAILGIMGVLATRFVRSLLGRNASSESSTSNEISGDLASPDYQPPGAPQAAADQSSGFTLPLVRLLEWRRFEMLVEGLFAGEGFIANRLRAGADGGVDLVLRQEKDGPPVGIVQCKTWASSVGVKPVRELFGVMAADGVAQGHFVCCGGYTREAVEWAQYKPMNLITGEELVMRLNRLPEGKRATLHAEITSGDYTSPTCPSCDIKMVQRTGKNGEFWGCPNYPRGCRSTLNVKV